MLLPNTSSFLLLKIKIALTPQKELGLKISSNMIII
jgi:hypothetical protein